MMNDKFDCMLYPEKSQYPYGVKDKNVISKFQRVTGLHFSSGLCIVTQNEKAVFVDGRYILAARRLLNQNEFEIYLYTKVEVEKFIRSSIPTGGTIAFDQNEYTISDIELFNLDEYKLVGIDVDEKPVDISTKGYSISSDISGENYTEKLAEIAYIFEFGDALLLNDALSISWLFNIRGNDDEDSLAIMARAIVMNDGTANIYTEHTCEIDILPDKVHMKSISELDDDIKKIRLLITDKNETPYRMLQYKNMVYKTNPCLILKSIKNKTEITNFRKIHICDGVAMTKFLYKLYHTRTPYTEISAANELRSIRKGNKGYICDSFDYISAADENSAEVHYHADKSSNKTIQNMYLVDSGAQYFGGTTDITRTVCLSVPTKNQKEMYTRVLMGHIDLSLSEASDNVMLDAIARKYITDIGENYPHSTGHGVGYMSHVHEGPIHISGKKCNTKFHEGMVISNEPGYYKAGEYGIRIENMMEVISVNEKLEFRMLTLVPYSKELIIYDMLNEAQKSWLQDYNQRLTRELSPFLDYEECRWLEEYTQLESKKA